MASIKKREHKKVVKDASGREKEVDVVRWRARYRDETGKEHARHFARKTDAQDWLDEIAAAKFNGTYVAPSAGKITLAQYVEDWRDRQLHRDRTTESFEGILRLHVLPELGKIPLEKIRTSHIQRLVTGWVKAGAAPTTIEGRYTLVSMIFKAAVKDRRIPATPCDGVKRPPIPPKSALVPITTETVIALRAAMPEHYRALVTVGAGTGLRRGELFGLTRDRVSDPFATVRVDRQLGKGTGDDVVFADVKTGASTRNVPVGEFVIKAIQEHEEAFGRHKSGLIFTSQIGTPLRPSTLWMAWSTAAKQVGTDATLHDLRHYFASMQIRGGTSIKALQQMLGHKSATETWDTYGHLIGDEDDRAREVMQSALAPAADQVRTGGTRLIRLRRSEA